MWRIAFIALLLAGCTDHRLRLVLQTDEPLSPEAYFSIIITRDGVVDSARDVGSAPGGFGPTLVLAWELRGDNAGPFGITVRAINERGVVVAGGVASNAIPDGAEHQVTLRLGKRFAVRQAAPDSQGKVDLLLMVDDSMECDRCSRRSQPPRLRLSRHSRTPAFRSTSTSAS